MKFTSQKRRSHEWHHAFDNFWNRIESLDIISPFLCCAAPLLPETVSGSELAIQLSIQKFWSYLAVSSGYFHYSAGKCSAFLETETINEIKLYVHRRDFP